MFGWFPLFYLTGDCTLYLANGSWEDLRSRKLTSEELSALSMDIALDRWSTLESKYCNNQTDGSGTIYYLNGESVNVQPCVGVYPIPPQWFSLIVISEVIKEWYGKATRFPSPLWYTLVRSDFPDALGPAFAAAPMWTHGNASELGTDDVRVTPPLRFADGSFAAELRDLRRLWLNGKIGYKNADFIPVLSGSTRYELRVRAVTTIDDDAGTPQLAK
jgi:hypothetical protein